ncbi:hypothetical protein JCM8097_005138 [Rhodosporidiobolus ruineniae]
MASSFVFYKFKSQREPSRVAFDGTAISVWDLKKEIIAENRMGRGADFDFAIYNADTEEEYTNDYTMIPRSTSVLARRLPPTKPGHGNAQKYMVGTDESGQGGLQAGRGAAPDPRGGVGAGQKGGYSKEMFSKRFDGREDGPPGIGGAASQGAPQVQLPAAAPNDEASAMAAMFAATNSQWQQTQEQMANATPIYNSNRPPPRPQQSGGSGGGAGGPGGARPSFRDSGLQHKAPPPGYICYRCGQKGHWIQECPTNGDPAYDNRPRIKRTTGIPKSFLTEVAGPATATGEDVDTALTGGVKGGIMVTADGGFVVARPDNASWLAHRALTANLSANDIQNLAPTDPDLTCPICSKLLRDAVLTPCCSTSFCDECVSNQLLDNDLLCPECETRVKSLDKLKPDEDRRTRCKAYVDEMLEASKERAEEEKKEREAEEERMKAAQEKAAQQTAEAAAAASAKKEAEEGEKKEGEVKGVEPVKTEEEELFPAKPEEIINPRQRRVGEDPGPLPPSSDMTKNGSSSSSAAATTSGPASSTPAAASPPRATSGTPNPPPSLPQVLQMGLPAGANAAMQAQMMRQQQMMGGGAGGGMGPSMASMGFNNGGGGMGMPTPPMVQQQMFQLSAMLQNPALPPPMRMALQAQLQQCQMMMMQFQRQMAMGMNGGMGGGGMGAQQAMRAGVPTGPAAMQQGQQQAAGQKRGREEEGAGPAAKK